MAWARRARAAHDRSSREPEHTFEGAAPRPPPPRGWAAQGWRSVLSAARDVAADLASLGAEEEEDGGLFGVTHDMSDI